VQFLYHRDAGSQQLILAGDEYRYIVKVRRHHAEDLIAMRNMRDDLLHSYRINAIDKKRAFLELIDTYALPVTAQKQLHLGWCIIDPKKIEKSLPALNETGVAKITFIRCGRSQSNFKIDIKRLETILVNSSQQCGRSSMMEIDFADSLETFIKTNPQTYMLDFSDIKLKPEMDIRTIVIGCEGGFEKHETALPEPEKIVGLDTPMILRSETAAVAVAARILL